MMAATPMSRPSESMLVDSLDRTSDSLCEVCREIFSDCTLEHHCDDGRLVEGKRRFVSQKHHSTPQDLKISAESGCFICSYLEHECAGFDFDRSEWYFSDNENIITLHFTIWRPKNYYNDTRAAPSFLVRPVRRPSVYRSSLASLSEEFVGCEESFDLVKEWLSRCLESHRVCRKPDKPMWYPTRVLDCSRPLIRLVETAGQEINGSYATMSHCWGKRSFPVLTSQNYAGFRHGVDQSEFPVSFRDGFVTCRRLGITYVWIDCYCIVQSGEGSEQDWRTESARMKDVYAHALLNIGSTHASNPYDGLFKARSSSPAKPFCIAWCPRLSDQKSLYRLSTGYEGPEYLKIFNEHDFFTRGWIFQERLLANRMLHFAKAQVYWECSGNGQTLASEEDPEGMPAPRFKQNLYPWALESSSSKLRNGQQSLQAQWADLVSNYSQLQLSFPGKDKLIAVGGIAERMAGLLQDKYVAGMFEKDLVMQLTWEVWRDRRRASIYRAPTWSWASSDGMISLPQSIGDAAATMQKLCLQLSNPDDPFGALVSASLRLRCRPIHVHLRPAAADPYRPVEPRLQIGKEIFAWTNDDDDELDSLPDLLIFVLLHVYIWAGPHRDRQLKLQKAVALRASGRDHGPDTFVVDYYGLVLRRDDEGCNRRVGAFVKHEDASLRIFDTWRNAADEIVEII